MPPKGWKKNAQPAVTGATPAPQDTKPAKATRIAKSRAVPKSTAVADKILTKSAAIIDTDKQVNSTDSLYELERKSTSLRASITCLSSVLATVSNLDAGTYAVVDSELRDTIDSLRHVRMEMLGEEAALNPVSTEPDPEVSSPVASKSEAPPTPAPTYQQPPQGMPFPPPPGQYPGYVPVASAPR